MGKIFKFIFEYLSTLLYSFGIAFMFWIYNPTGTVSNKVFFSIVIPLIIFVVISAKLIFINASKNKEQKDVLSKIIVIKDKYILLFPSNLYSAETIISIYFKDGEFERYMGYGYVETIQNNSKNVQIKIINIEKNMIEKFKNINKDKILVKPSISKNIIGILNGGKNE